MSLDSVKKSVPDWTSLSELFKRRYGGVHSPAFYRARRNFVQSAAAYSVVCYLLQVKDRHNGNILLHADGSLVQEHAQNALARSSPRSHPPLQGPPACSGRPPVSPRGKPSPFGRRRKAALESAQGQHFRRA